MGPEVIIVGTFALLFGGMVGYAFKDKLAKLINKKQRDIDKVINSPELLVEKLNNNGKMVDSGEELRYSVKEENGEKKVVLEKSKNKAETKKKDKAVVTNARKKG